MHISYIKRQENELKQKHIQPQNSIVYQPKRKNRLGCQTECQLHILPDKINYINRYNDQNLDSETGNNETGWLRNEHTKKEKRMEENLSEKKKKLKEDPRCTRDKTSERNISTYLYDQDRKGTFVHLI